MRKTIAVLAILFLTLLPSSVLAAVSFIANGVVTQPQTVLLYSSRGLPSVMTFTIMDEDYQTQTIVCRRPHLSACTFVDSTTIGKKVHVTGILEMFDWTSGFGWAGWQLSAQSTSLVYADYTARP